MSRCAVVLVLSILASACGGGGGGSSEQQNVPTLSVPSKTLNFAAAHPASPIPATQYAFATVTGSVSGTLYVRVVVSDPAMISVSDVAITSATSGQAIVTPTSPAKIGAGSHTSTIQVIACTTDINCSGAQLAGSPQTITVNYQVGSPVQIDTVMPSTVVSGRPGYVVLRGAGFNGATGVGFGGTQASAISVVSDSEIRATYSALSAGTYPVTVHRGNATVAYSATVTAVDPTVYAPTKLQYPPGLIGTIQTIYDAQRKAVIVAVNSSNPANNQVLRYAFVSGAWQPPTIVTMPNLRDMTMSPDNSKLLVATDSTIAQVNPETLTVIGTAAKPFASNEYIKQLGATNDGNVIVSTGYQNGTGSTTVYLYSLKDASFSIPRVHGYGSFATNSVYYSTTSISDDGAVAYYLSPAANGGSLYRYLPSTGQWPTTPLPVRPYSGAFTSNDFAVSMDGQGSKFTFITQNVAFSGYDVGLFDANLTRRGTLPFTTAKSVMSHSGARVYTIDRTNTTPAVCTVRAFDTTTLAGSASSQPNEITAGFPIGIECSSVALVALDDRSLFVPTNSGVQVVPVP